MGSLRGSRKLDEGNKMSGFGRSDNYSKNDSSLVMNSWEIWDYGRPEVGKSCNRIAGGWFLLLLQAQMERAATNSLMSWFMVRHQKWLLMN